MTTAPDGTPEGIHETVRARYAAAITEVTADGGSGCCGRPAQETFAASKYSAEYRDGIDPRLVQASFGCGNPVLVGDLKPGERVLDLGSGGGLDVLISARRVGRAGRAYGLDMTDEMLETARANAAEAEITNVEFRKGHIEKIPLPNASVDVVISNCVINLSPDKPAVFAEIMRVLAPGGRLGVTDIVCDDDVTAQQRTLHGDWASCAAGALARGEYLAGLRSAGFVDVDVRYTDDFPHGMHAAIIRATVPDVPDTPDVP
ncbi:MAG: arsenite methyltransferase [Dactylosporangium sp.]|nr:arsenite methyltransferase [Dactylosporangium sp.]NNJ62875.1 arsenite methyltransferase [Dactylosporangium sp.]